MHIMLAFQKPNSQEHINGDQISRSGSAKKCVPASRRPCTRDVVLKPRVVRRQLMVVVHSHTDRVPVAKALRQIKVLALFIAGLVLIGFGRAEGRWIRPSLSRGNTFWSLPLWQKASFFAFGASRPGIGRRTQGSAASGFNRNLTEI
jgi:hypothetical protein